MPVRALSQLTLAWFDATGLDIAPPAWLQQNVLAFVPDMPADLEPGDLTQPAYQWLRLASAFDFADISHGARHLLDRIERAAPQVLDRANARELHALVCARRGRLARQRGELDAAGDWYQRGLACTDGARHRAAWGACVQGLANLAQARKDFGTAERLSRLITLHGNVVPRYAHVAALLTLAVLHRRQYRYSAATRCAWQAYDLVDGCDERRAMALVELAYLALARGEIGAAERGFAVVLSFACSIRVRRPARSGALATALARWRTNEGDSIARDAVKKEITALLAEVRHTHHPHERLQAQRDARAASHALSEPARDAERQGAAAKPCAGPKADEVRALARLAALALVPPLESVNAVA